MANESLRDHNNSQFGKISRAIVMECADAMKRPGAKSVTIRIPIAGGKIMPPKISTEREIGD